MALVVICAVKTLAQSSSPNHAALDDSLPAPAIYGVSNGSLVVIDPATGEIEAIGPPLPFQNAAALIPNPLHPRLYVLESGGNRIAVVNTHTLQVEGIFSEPFSFNFVLGTGFATISPSGSKIYVLAPNDFVDVISTRSGAVDASIPLSSGPDSVAVGDFGNKVYISLSFENRIVVVNASTDQIIGSFLDGLCSHRSEGEKCEIKEMLTGSDGRYIMGASPRTSSVAAIDTTIDKVVADTVVGFGVCPFDALIGVNAAADQIAVFTEACEHEYTAFVSALPPFGVVRYDLPNARWAGALTAAFDPTGTIGYLTGDRRFTKGNVIQFTSQSYRFIDIGSPAPLVLVP
ncbi:MAG TPA: hypothetical protein VEV38_02900 [Candidatus Eremiobacteraceae bacterium]|nr:hypothetical protein [Candidatus Eremiobacteraceae bacterium]